MHDRLLFPHAEGVSTLEYCTNALKNLKGVSFGCLNVCSLRHKVDDLSCLLQKSELDFLATTETHLDDLITDPEIIYSRFYNTSG